MKDFIRDFLRDEDPDKLAALVRIYGSEDLIHDYDDAEHIMQAELRGMATITVAEGYSRKRFGWKRRVEVPEIGAYHTLHRTKEDAETGLNPVAH